MTRVRAAAAAILIACVAALAVSLAACGGGDSAQGGTSSGGAAKPVIAVTTPILGAVVRDAVGNAADVRVIMPNGSDPHEWRPSARDIADLQSADLIVRNGLGLEQGLGEALDQAQADGTPVFTATDHVDVRSVGAGEASDAGAGAEDPHFWTDPVQMRKVVLALPAAVRSATGADISAPARREAAALAALDTSLARQAATVPQGARNLVSGHESLGYLARRYGFRVTGAVLPSLSSQGQASAAHLADLAAAMRRAGVRVVFAEAGTPEQVAQAVSDETGAVLVELPSHSLTADGTYAGYMSQMMRRITSAITGQAGG